jgi:Carboxymuconolactone decarboxylase family
MAAGFTEAQIQTLLLTNAVTNGCSWAVAFHTGLALKEGLDQTDVQAIRERRIPKDATSAALSTFAKTLIEKRGRVDDHDVDAFVAVGFRKEHALEVIAVVAASTITNYTASVTKPPVDEPFRAYCGAPDNRAGFPRQRPTPAERRSADALAPRPIRSKAPMAERPLPARSRRDHRLG